MRKISILTFLLTLCVSLNIVNANSIESIDAKIARAMSAAPLDISYHATILDVDGTILRKGTNTWTCMPGVSLIPGDKHPMCNDKVWMAWMKAAAQGKPFSTDVMGVAYMLQGDGLVSNDDPAQADQTKGNWVEEGPHLMLLMPYSSLKNLPRDPYSGGPYVMWDKTPLVHVMVPINTKSK